MKCLCVSVLLCIVVVTNAVQFIDCGSKLCKINSVDVTGCAANAQTCDLVRGKTVNMTMKFTTVQEVNNLENKLAGEIKSVWVPFSTTDACKAMTPSCPVKAGIMVTYVYSLKISKLYPQILVPIRSQITDNNGNVCTCFEVQGKIV